MKKKQTKPIRMVFKAILKAMTALCCLALLQSVGYAISGEVQTPDPVSQPSGEPKDRSDPQKIREDWGIELLGVRLTAAGHMLDFRYRVIDPEKASLLLRRDVKPYLIDQATGSKFSVPRTKLGPMRQTAVKPAANRNYIILFGNPGGTVKPGSKVTFVLGDLKIEDLVVE